PDPLQRGAQLGGLRTPGEGQGAHLVPRGPLVLGARMPQQDQPAAGRARVRRGTVADAARVRAGSPAARTVRARARHRPIAWTPPSTWTISPVVAGNQSDSSAATARAVGSGSDTSQPSGARSGQPPSICSN